MYIYIILCKLLCEYTFAYGFSYFRRLSPNGQCPGYHVQSCHPGVTFTPRRLFQFCCTATNPSCNLIVLSVLGEISHCNLIPVTGIGLSEGGSFYLYQNLFFLM